MDKHVISILVNNYAGVLSRVSGLFSRRGFNIDSLAVGETEDLNVSRITIVVAGDDYVVDQVVKQLAKLIDVLKVVQLDKSESISRELVIIKVGTKKSNRAEVIQIVEIFRANIIDVSHATLTIEITGTSNKINGLLNLLEPFGVLEIVRTGSIAIQRGSKIIKA